MAYATMLSRRLCRHGTATAHQVIRVAQLVAQFRESRPVTLVHRPSEDTIELPCEIGSEAIVV